MLNEKQFPFQQYIIPFGLGFHHRRWKFIKTKIVQKLPSRSKLPHSSRLLPQPRRFDFASTSQNAIHMNQISLLMLQLKS